MQSLQTDFDRVFPRRSVPPVPPSHPAFTTLLRSIARVTEEQGPRAAARMCRQRVEVLNEQIACCDAARADRMTQSGLSAFDIAELVSYLEARAGELEGA